MESPENQEHQDTSPADTEQPPGQDEEPAFRPPKMDQEYYGVQRPKEERDRDD